MELNDSFSGSNENNFVLQDIKQRPQKPVKKTSSPIFGSSSSKIEEFPIEDNKSRSELFFENPFSIHEDLSTNQGGNEKLTKIKIEIEVKEEEHKQQILHIETLGMMTKYQLVFIKLETSLYKFDHLIATRETLLKSEAFYSILNFIKFNNLALIYKKRLVANRLKKTLTNKLFSPLDFFIKKTIANGFYKIFEYSKVFSNQRKFNEELNFIKEENALTLKKRDQDLKILAKKSEELSNEINSLKHRENEYSSKIKLQDQMINSLQQDPHLVHSNDQLPQNSLLAKKNIPLNEGNTKVKALEQKFKELENENQDLKEKLSQTENNLGMFIKEMSELLDNHEISTNIGTDDNYSLNNSNNNNNNVNFDQNLEEELENLIRLKGKTQEEERDNFNAKSLATKENRLLSQNAKNVIKSNRSNANTFRKNKK